MYYYKSITHNSFKGDGGSINWNNISLESNVKNNLIVYMFIAFGVLLVYILHYYRCITFTKNIRYYLPPPPPRLLCWLLPFLFFFLDIMPDVWISDRFCRSEGTWGEMQWLAQTCKDYNTITNTIKMPLITNAMIKSALGI